MNDIGIVMGKASLPEVVAIQPIKREAGIVCRSHGGLPVSFYFQLKRKLSLLDINQTRCFPASLFSIRARRLLQSPLEKAGQQYQLITGVERTPLNPTLG